MSCNLLKFFLIGVFAQTQVLATPDRRGCEPSGKQIHVASFNFMNRNMEGDKAFESDSQKKIELVSKWIREQKIDILGTQEILNGSIQELSQKLPEFSWVGRGRGPSEKLDEFVAIFYRKSRFEKLEDGTFWLSETPKIAGWKGWDATHPRIATWIKIKDRVSEKEIFVFNTHLENSGQLAKKKGAELVAKKMSQAAEKTPMILVGDMNADGKGFLRKAFHKFRFAREISKKNPEGDVATFMTGTQIDHILLTPDFRACRFVTHQLLSPEGRRVSDHSPISSLVELTSR